jgi:hypothetical protein
MVDHFIAWGLAIAENLNFVFEVNRVIQDLEHILGKIDINFVHDLVVVENFSEDRKELFHMDRLGDDSE